MKYPKCDYENKDGALYCGMCMESFQKKSCRKCPDCGADLTDNLKFCTKCGAKLNVDKNVLQKNNHSSSNKPIKKNQLSVISFYCGISCVPLFIIFIFSMLNDVFLASLFPLQCCVSVILGHKALFQISNSKGEMKGKGNALTGLILGYLGLIMFFLFLLFWLVMKNNI